ncbi:hypothetical protein L6164_016689 [Bauhinia variegata]|uniref:Uncharacterized protein n=1 Tax=Bauhinia variegata TaxID=167791 RepID=A0ACB9NPD7_BAUVA|nr:hypothetical protein L6164_016689 [Bauhinia variegata]
MPISTKDLDSAFQAAGANLCLEVWCIENEWVVPVSKSCHGKFYTGNAYVVLNTVYPNSGAAQYNITLLLDSGLASDTALEPDAALGSCSVQYKEVQGQESEEFLSYFKPCIIPIEGVYRSLQGKINGEYQITLYTCKSDHVVRVTEVPFLRGCNSTIHERVKALDVIRYIKENKHGGECEVATTEDGKFVGDSDVGEFLSIFGGYAPIPQELPSVQQQYVAPSTKLFWGKIEPHGN